MEKRVRFNSAWLPWVLLAPQVAIIGVFFFWPAAQAVLQSLQVQDSFGLSTEWAGLDNFFYLFGYEDTRAEIDQSSTALLRAGKTQAQQNAGPDQTSGPRKQEKRGPVRGSGKKIEEAG